MAIESHLFQHLNFLIVVTEATELKDAEKTAQLLRSHACNRCEIYQEHLSNDKKDNSDVRSRFLERYGGEDMINFIISEKKGFPFYHVAAFDFLIPVITSAWIDTCISTKRLHRTAAFSPDERHIFKGYQIYVSRHSFKHAEYLFIAEMVHALGGTCIDFLSNRTTHLVSKNSNDPAITAVIGFGKVDSIKFVFPTWVVQSFKDLSVASAEEHAIDPTCPAETLNEKLQDLWSVVNESEFKKKSSIFENHSFIIGLDVSLGKDLYATLIEMLQCNSATVIRHVDEKDIKREAADCYIGSSVTSKEYEAASSLDFELGNLIWIFFMWSIESFRPARSKVIFLPFKKKVFETNELILSYSNYYGSQRYYIQRLAELLGGYSTAELSRKNTHLVSQFAWGKKFETGLKWESCTVVNHLWLEAAYKLGSKLDPKEARFQQFPVSGGLRASLGQNFAENPPSKPMSNDFVSSAKQKDPQERAAIPPLMTEDEGFPDALTNSNNIENKASRQASEVEYRADTPSVETAFTPFNRPDIESEERTPDKVREIKEFVHDRDMVTKSSPVQNTGSKSSQVSVLEVKAKGAEFQTQEVRHEKDCMSAAPGADEQHEELDKKSGTEQGTVTKPHTNNGAPVSLTPDPPAITSRENNQVTPSTRLASQSRSQTPLLSLSSSQTLHSSGGSRRAAKTKAAQKLHDDIEMLNEYQRSSKRKKTGSLLPQEIAQQERIKFLELQAKSILEPVLHEVDSSPSDFSTSTARKKQPYNMDVVCTGSHEIIKDLDKVILELLGIRIHEEITALNLHRLNTVIAPKKMRTAKFLKSYSFHPLRYALKPEFLTDLLSVVHNPKSKKRHDLLLDLSKYTIPGVDNEFLLKQTSLAEKIFERAGISNINLVSDVTGGVDVISSILKAHGVKEVRVVPATNMNKLSIDDLAMNNRLEKSTTDNSPDCLIIVTKSSQVKHFKRIVKDKCDRAMAVEWNWCISSIFDLNVSYSDNQHIIYLQNAKSGNRRSSKA